MSSPGLRLATLVALFFALVLFAEPSLADDHQNVVTLGSLGASVTITPTAKGTYFITPYSRVTSISISSEESLEPAVGSIPSSLRL
ncbi:MAG: hypothetical protein F4Y47_05570 [Acidobacteriia bacterium]|nr:hypothetical protein [Terriglobia bacterium]MYK09039.1 hypothetical protein [Terriglobia bacterium]